MESYAPYGILWNPIESYGILWNPMESYAPYGIGKIIESYVTIWNIKDNTISSVWNTIEYDRIRWNPMEHDRILCNKM